MGDVNVVFRRKKNFFFLMLIEANISHRGYSEKFKG